MNTSTGILREDKESTFPSYSVVLFVVDGLRPDGIEESSTPQIDGLMKNGAHTFKARTVMPSITLPCIASMFLGTEPEHHGITTNTWVPMARRIPSVIDIIHSAGKTCASFYNWEPLRDLSIPGSLDAAVFRRNCDAPQGDREIADAAAQYLSNNNVSFVFIYLGYTDAAGHAHGWMSETYLEAVENADAAIEKVIDTLKNKGRLEDTFLIVTSDHGGHESTHGTDLPEDLIVPWIISGPGIPSGLTLEDDVHIIDTAPTVAALLEVEISKQWTGRVISGLVQPARNIPTVNR